MNESNPKFRPVNRILGAQPSLGPVPANQVLPWALIFIFSWFIGQGILGLSWLHTGFLAAWLGGTWWILTGNQAWRFLAKFVPVPHVTRGYARYQSLLLSRSYERKNRQRKAKRR